MIRLIFLFTIISGVFPSDLNESTSCVTPNHEHGTCIALIGCPEIAKIILSSFEAYTFAQASLCGSSKEMVCCGPLGYLKSLAIRPTVTLTPTPSKEEIRLADFSDPSICGLHASSMKVKGGRVTEFDEFPWVVALEYVSKLDNTNAGIRCGGSLISNTYVLTAAHCIVHVEFVVTKAWFGATNISSNENCLTLTGNQHCVNSIQKRIITETFPHPFYNMINKSHDIGLLMLDYSVEFNEYIRPICLPRNNSLSSPIRTYLTVAGWGSTENSSTSSDIKLRVDLPVQNYSVCNESLQYKKMNSEQLCVGGEAGKDSCRGDSGGPLMKSFSNANGAIQWLQEGIVSYGVGCGIQGRPGVYVKVSSYIPWILQKMLSINKGAPCVTPNGEIVTCVPLASCKAIVSALDNNPNFTALEFLRQSRCGYDIKPLVCCGSTGYPSFDTFTFTKAPETENEDEKNRKIEASFSTKSLPDRTLCGFEKNNGSNAIARIGTFPWMVAVEYKSKLTGESAGIKCGGSLINNRYVLTAASCILDEEFEIIKVWLGEWRISENSDCDDYMYCTNSVENVVVKQQIPHPFYSKKFETNNIGLLKLKTDVTYTNYIRPICLQPRNLPIYPQQLLIPGWGVTIKRTSSHIHLKGLLSNMECRKRFQSGRISPYQLCVDIVYENHYHETCGNRGAPLMSTYYKGNLDELTQYYQEGVINYDCGYGPHRFTRVTKYINWIINVIATD